MLCLKGAAGDSALPLRSGGGTMVKILWARPPDEDVSGEPPLASSAHRASSRVPRSGGRAEDGMAFASDVRAEDVRLSGGPMIAAWHGASDDMRKAWLGWISACNIGLQKVSQTPCELDSAWRHGPIHLGSGSRGEMVETNQLGEPMVTMQLGMLPKFQVPRARVKKLSRAIACVTNDQARLGQPLHYKNETLSPAAASALRSHLLLDSSALFALPSPDKEILADEYLLDEAKRLMAQDKKVTWVRCVVCHTEYVEKDNGPQSCPGMPRGTCVHCTREGSCSSCSRAASSSCTCPIIWRRHRAAKGKRGGMGGKGAVKAPPRAAGRGVRR